MRYAKHAFSRCLTSLTVVGLMVATLVVTSAFVIPDKETTTSPLQGVVLNESIPLPPVINDCNGETLVATAGAALHILITATVDGNGGGHFQAHFQPQNGNFVGTDTGIRYRGTGVTQFSDNFTPGNAEVHSITNNFRLIAVGAPSGATLLIHGNMKMVIHSDGTFSVDFFMDSLTCT